MLRYTSGSSTVRNVAMDPSTTPCFEIVLNLVIIEHALVCPGQNVNVSSLEDRITPRESVVKITSL